MNRYKTLFLTSFLLFSLLSSAQTDSVSILRFVYECQDINFKESRDYNDIMNLDIQHDGSSHFYSIYNDYLTASNLEGKNLDEVLSALDSSKKGALFQIFRNATNNELTFVTTAPDNFYYKEKELGLEWSIKDGDTMSICGYLCKKATTTLSGRNWTAWFSEELPIGNGPWKLYGLPGLILSAHDADNFFQFTCIGIEQAIISQEQINTKSYTRCTNTEYQKQLRLQAKDPTNYALRKLGLPSITANEATIMVEGGKMENKLPKFDHIFLEKIPGDKK